MKPISTICPIICGGGDDALLCLPFGGVGRACTGIFITLFSRIAIDELTGGDALDLKESAGRARSPRISSSSCESSSRRPCSRSPKSKSPGEFVRDGTLGFRLGPEDEAAALCESDAKESNSHRDPDCEGTFRLGCFSAGTEAKSPRPQSSSWSRVEAEALVVEGFELGTNAGAADD